MMVQTCSHCDKKIIALVRKKVYHYCFRTGRTYVVTDMGFKLGEPNGRYE